MIVARAGSAGSVPSNTCVNAPIRIVSGPLAGPTTSVPELHAATSTSPQEAAAMTTLYDLMGCSAPSRTIPAVNRTRN